MPRSELPNHNVHRPSRTAKLALTGCVLAALAIAGCDTPSIGQLASGGASISAATASAPLEKAVERAGIKANHNETFLASPNAD